MLKTDNISDLLKHKMQHFNLGRLKYEQIQDGH